jgi:curved DNA-binding protein CbpA
MKHYQALGLPQTAAADEIKRAYRRLAKELHPDANPGDAAAEQKFKAVATAYGVLSDPGKRREYDQMLVLGVDLASPGARRPSVATDPHVDPALALLAEFLRQQEALFREGMRPLRVDPNDLRYRTGVTRVTQTKRGWRSWWRHFLLGS